MAQIRDKNRFDVNQFYISDILNYLRYSVLHSAQDVWNQMNMPSFRYKVEIHEAVKLGCQISSLMMETRLQDS